MKVSANAGHGERAGFLSFAPTATPLYANIPSFFSIFPAPSNSDDPYNFYGIDMDYRRGSWVVKSEAYVTDEDAEGPAAGDRNGYYFQPAYYITPEWAVVMRYDVFNAGQGLGKAREIVLGVNYDPNPNVRWRLEFSNIDTSDVVLASTDPSMSNPVPRSAADSIQVLTFSASFSF